MQVRTPGYPRRQLAQANHFAGWSVLTVDLAADDSVVLVPNDPSFRRGESKGPYALLAVGGSRLLER